MSEPFVGELVDADLRVRARVADLEAHDLTRGGVRGQRRGGVHVQSPLPHAEQIHAPNVGQARPQACESGQEDAQVLRDALDDDVDSEVAARRRRGGFGRPRMATRQVSEHRREGLEDAGVISHGGVNACQNQGDEGSPRVDPARRLVRRVHEAYLRLGGEAGEDVLRLGQRGPQLRNLAHGAPQHLRQRIRPVDKGRGRRKGGGEHPTQDQGRHLRRVPQGPRPRLEQGGQGNAAVPHAHADQGLHGHLERDSQMRARLQGIHRGRQGGHRRCRIRAGVAVRHIPAVQVVKERREPGGLLGPRAARRDDHRCIQFHSFPFKPLTIVLTTLAVCDLT